MVANGQVEPVGLNGLLGAANHDTHIVGVVLARVKVGVVPDEHGHVHLGSFSVKDSVRLNVVSEASRSTEDLLKGLSQLNSVGLAGSSEGIQGGLAEVVVLGHREEGSIKETLVLEDAQVDDVVTDPGATDFLAGLGVSEDAEGQVLQRELRVGIVGEP